MSNAINRQSLAKYSYDLNKWRDTVNAYNADASAYNAKGAEFQGMVDSVKAGSDSAYAKLDDGTWALVSGELNGGLKPSEVRRSGSVNKYDLVDSVDGLDTYKRYDGSGFYDFANIAGTGGAVLVRNSDGTATKYIPNGVEVIGPNPEYESWVKANPYGPGEGVEAPDPNLYKNLWAADGSPIKLLEFSETAPSLDRSQAPKDPGLTVQQLANINASDQPMVDSELAERGSVFQSAIPGRASSDEGLIARAMKGFK